MNRLRNSLAKVHNIREELIHACDQLHTVESILSNVLHSPPVPESPPDNEQTYEPLITPETLLEECHANNKTLHELLVSLEEHLFPMIDRHIHRLLKDKAPKTPGLAAEDGFVDAKHNDQFESKP